MLSPHDALIWTMVLVSAADQDMTPVELRTMSQIVAQLPVFEDFDKDEVAHIANGCAKLLANADGLELALGDIAGALGPRLSETAYALACDIAAADGRAGQEEMRMLELLRHRLDVDRLTAAAIERGARARWARI